MRRQVLTKKPFLGCYIESISKIAKRNKTKETNKGKKQIKTVGKLMKYTTKEKNIMMN